MQSNYQSLIARSPGFNWPNIFLLLSVFLLASSCEEWELEKSNFLTVVTLEADQAGLNPTEIRLKGQIAGLLDDKSVDEHGHLWSTDLDQPTLDDEVGFTRLQRSQNNEFESLATDISPGQVIHYRAYAILGQEVKYGEVKLFSTSALSFQIDSDSIISNSRNKTLSQLEIGASVSELPPQLTISYGHVWAKHPEPTLESDDFTVIGRNIFDAEQFSFSSTLNLEPGRYYVRAYVSVVDAVYYSAPFCLSLGDFWVLEEVAFRTECQVGSSGFSLGGTGYFTNGDYTGNLPGISCRELWNYNPVSKEWSQKTSLPFFTPRQRGFTATTSDRAYLGMGMREINGFEDEYYKDIKEYDPTTDEWRSIASFISPRADVTAFAINDVLYVGMGYVLNEERYTFDFADDFWRYDALANQWDSLRAFPGGARSGGISFAVQDKGYLLDDNEFWEYLPLEDKWQEKPYPTGLTHRPRLEFIIDDKVFIESGNKFWEYDPIVESWTDRIKNPSGAIGVFTIDGVGYAMSKSQAGEVWAYYPLMECE